MTAKLFLGRWQEALANVDAVDAVICDPPYGAKTHDGHNDLAGDERFSDPERTKPTQRTLIAYDALMPSEVAAFVEAWAPRCSGWMLAMTSHDLIPAWEQAYERAGRLAFAPLPIIQKRPRLVGDGPSSWAVYAMVSRPRTRAMATWGCLPGAYEAPTVKDAGLAGAKPLDLMRAIVRDYSRPGDLVCDPFVGSGTTLLAAVMEGRRAVGSEQKREHYDIAAARLARGYTPTMFAE
jgi:site-specific DNA-methyltransferase (adenine-specific)